MCVHVLSRVTLFVFLGSIAIGAPPAAADIDLLFEPGATQVSASDAFEVDIVARSSGATAEQLTALDAILSWDANLVELVGFNLSRSPHSWTNWGFLNDICGVNDGIDDPPVGIPTNDGTAVYTAWGNVSNPPSVGPEGLIVATLEFRALQVPAETTIGYLVDVTAGEQTCVTQVLGEGIGNDVTGDISNIVAVAIVGQFNPPTLCEDTCHLGNVDLGTPCTTDNDCNTGVGEVCGLKSRYISITTANPATPTSIQVEVVSCPQFPGIVGEIWYAGPEQALPNPPHPALSGAPLQCVPAEVPVPNVQAWTAAGCLHVWGPALVPDSTYDVRHCDAVGAICSSALRIATGKWGDVLAPFGGGSQPNFGDISAVVDKFRNEAAAPDMPRTDLVGPGNPGDPNSPNQAVNFGDISADVDAFRGFAYPFAVPSCP